MVATDIAGAVAQAATDIVLHNGNDADSASAVVEKDYGTRGGGKEGEDEKERDTMQQEEETAAAAAAAAAATTAAARRGEKAGIAPTKYCGATEGVGSDGGGATTTTTTSTTTPATAGVSGGGRLLLRRRANFMSFRLVKNFLIVAIGIIILSQISYLVNNGNDGSSNNNNNNKNYNNRILTRLSERFGIGGGNFTTSFKTWLCNN